MGALRPGQDSTIPTRPLHLRKGPDQLPVYHLSAPNPPFSPSSVLWETLKHVPSPAGAILGRHCRDAGGKGFPWAPACPLLTPQAQRFVLGELLCVPGFLCTRLAPWAAPQPGGLWPQPACVSKGAGLSLVSWDFLSKLCSNFHKRKLAKM